MKYVIISLVLRCLLPLPLPVFTINATHLLPYFSVISHLPPLWSDGEEIPILYCLGRRHRLHDPRTRTGVEEHARCAHELQLGNFRAHAAARAGTPGEEGVFHCVSGVGPAVWVEAQWVQVEGRIAVEGVSLC
jgi:hypothetical protein